MATTFLTLRSEVERMAGIASTDTELVALVKEAVNRAQYDIARETKWAESLIVNHEIALTGILTTPFAVNLPALFLFEERVKFYRAATTTTWILSPRTGINFPVTNLAGNYQLPQRYAIIQGAAANPYKIQLEPVTSVSEANDKIRLSYFSAPVNMAADGDVVVSNLWDQEIVKRATQMTLIKMGRLPQQQALQSLQSIPPSGKASNDSN